MIRTLSQIALIVGLIVVNVLSLVPHESMPEIGTGDKMSHFLAYAALSLAGVLGFNLNPEVRFFAIAEKSLLD